MSDFQKFIAPISTTKFARMATIAQRPFTPCWGLKIDGTKEILGLYTSDTEGANFWLTRVTDINNRGVKDILIACVDGLSGFPDAVNAIFPDAEVQLCIINQIRNSMSYAGSKNHKEFMADLKLAYKAKTKDLAEIALDSLDEKWGKRYPIVIRSWRKK